MAQRWFIGFFGITRALEWTIESIEQKIYAPLESAGIELIRAAHFNQPATLEAPRSKEVDVPFQVGDLSRLRLDHQVIEPQSNENIATFFKAALEVPYRDEEDPGGFTRRNALHQLYSLRGLGKIFSGLQPGSFQAALLLRPDMRYVDPLPVSQMLARLHRGSPWRRAPWTEGVRLLRRTGKPEADIITPSWSLWGGYNDRFCVATPEAALVYMNRIHEVENYCRELGNFHSETLLKYAMTKAGMRGTGTKMRAQRIRSDGSIHFQEVEFGE